MKKNLLLIIALFVATSMSAQFYAGLGLGYGLGASKRANGIEYSGTNNAIQTNIYGSYGQGFNTTLKLGFMFNDNMGLELGVSYLFGASQTVLKSGTELIEAKSDGLRLMPQLVYRLDNGFYGRFGVIIPVLGKTTVTGHDDNGFGPGVKTEFVRETHGSFSIGFAGAIGYNYTLSDNMNLFCELEYIGLSIKSSTATVTQYDVNGTSILDKLPTSSKEIEYVDEIDTSTIPDSTKASQQLKQKAPFSSFGLNVGITMTF